MLDGQRIIGRVTIDLPAGMPATFHLAGQNYTERSAVCFVVKDAGDDPDVTNGAELHAEVTRIAGNVLEIAGGTGIGRVTKPGLAVPPGEWAINPVPRSMITEAVRAVFPCGGFRVTISVPDGAARARKTLNERLGIIGGLSILGTTGIVRPVSAKAWTDTIDAALDVARACGCPTVVLSTGRTSEVAAQGQLRLPEEAFVMMGDHVSHALRASYQRGYVQPLIACQFAKLLKIACGHENTHAAQSQLDLSRLLEWTDERNLPSRIRQAVAAAHTAREAVISCGYDRALLEVVAGKASAAASLHTAQTRPRFLICGYDGHIYGALPEFQD